MQLRQLDHVNVRTSNLEEMTAWYERVLGMKNGARPSFNFGGAWLYCNGSPFVHLIEVESEPAAGTDLKLEHFAFSATGMGDFIDCLKSDNAGYKIVEIPDFDIVQVNIWDPDGNHIHVDFHMDEAKGLDV
ncbi:MAG: VOC family protein [Methyloligellaceae bacterium]